MVQNLTTEDIESIAQRVVEIIGERLTKPTAKATPLPAESPLAGTPEKLAYSVMELCEALGLCRATFWRLEALGRIRSVPGVRRKLYSQKEVERFLSSEERNMTSWDSDRMPRR